ncbi:nucleotidyltransferase domain-containing protein [Candidatus Woesearchaeota archaeon]|nr:nucleotidyltransferase domain-containing protein [Candidatus Woesearchaeota archaeon]
MRYELIAYAMDFASFLIQKVKEKDKINNIILFGSAARGEAGKSSDIDIFVDLVKETPELERDIQLCLDKFIDSIKYKDYWRLLGIRNEIKLMVGELAKWKSLNLSMISNGILLYGKYKPEIKEGKHMTFFIWENIRPNSKRVLFNKQLFGFKQGGKFYQGIIQKYGGERLGKGCILVPLDKTNVFHSHFKKYKVNVKIKKVLEYF